MKIYFAHPISSYGTPEEQRIISALTRAGFDVVNPAAPVHQKAVDDMYARGGKDAGDDVMRYFVALCQSCDGCVFMPFPDGSVGAGIVKEAQSFLNAGKDVREAHVEKDRVVLTDVKDLSRYKLLTVNETRAALRRLMPSYKR